MPISLPVVQLVIGVRDGNSRLFQISDRAGDVSCGHIVARVVVVANNQDTCVMSSRRRHDEIVQVLEVAVVPRQDGTLVTDGVGQVSLVTTAGESDVGGNPDIVPVTTQQPEQYSLIGRASRAPRWSALAACRCI